MKKTANEMPRQLGRAVMSTKVSTQASKSQGAKKVLASSHSANPAAPLSPRSTGSVARAFDAARKAVGSAPPRVRGLGGLRWTPEVGAFCVGAAITNT